MSEKVIGFALCVQIAPGDAPGEEKKKSGTYKYDKFYGLVPTEPFGISCESRAGGAISCQLRKSP